MIEPSMAAAYAKPVKQTGSRDTRSAELAELAELRALVEQQQRQIRTLARACGQTAEAESISPAVPTRGEVDPKKFGNTEGLKHGLTSHYIEKPFRELEEELKEEGGELRLPNSIYTVAICAGFFCDGNIWVSATTPAPCSKDDACCADTARHMRCMHRMQSKLVRATSPTLLVGRRVRRLCPRPLSWPGCPRCPSMSRR